MGVARECVPDAIKCLENLDRGCTERKRSHRAGSSSSRLSNPKVDSSANAGNCEAHRRARPCPGPERMASGTISSTADSIRSMGVEGSEPAHEWFPVGDDDAGSAHGFPGVGAIPAFRLLHSGLRRLRARGTARNEDRVTRQPGAARVGHRWAFRLAAATMTGSGLGGAVAMVVPGPLRMGRGGGRWRAGAGEHELPRAIPRRGPWTGSRVGMADRVAGKTPEKGGGLQMSGDDVLSPELEGLGLRSHVAELARSGLCVVPPEVTGASARWVRSLSELVLRRTTEFVGCGFTLERGPDAALEYHPDAEPVSIVVRTGDRPNQVVVQQLAGCHRAFRDLAVHPVAVALVRHLIGETRTRFSHHQCFVKWRDEHGYGSDARIACRPDRGPGAVGRDGVRRERDVVPHGLHAGGRGPRLCSRFSPARRQAGRCEGSARGGACRSGGGKPDRLSRGDLAWRVSEDGPRIEVVRDEPLSALHGHSTGGPSPLSGSAPGRRLPQSRVVPGARRVQRRVSLCHAAQAGPGRVVGKLNLSRRTACRRRRGTGWQPVVKPRVAPRPKGAGEGPETPA